MGPAILSRAIGRAAAAALVLSGCAGPSPVLFPDSSRAPVEVRPGRAGAVVAARPGRPDPVAAEIAAEVARRTGFGLVAGGGRLRVEPAEWAGDPAHDASLKAAARGPLRLYAEIGGGDEGAERIEIVATGVSAAMALRLRTLWELIREAHVRAHAGAPRLDARVEPAAGAPASGAGPAEEPRWSGWALHIALPRAARREWRELYTAILAHFLLDAVAVAPGIAER